MYYRGHFLTMRDIPFPAKSVCEPAQYNHYWDWRSMILQEDNDLESILTAKERGKLWKWSAKRPANKLITRQLNIFSTVKTHFTYIFAKTEVINRTELVSRTRMFPVQHSQHMKARAFNPRQLPGSFSPLSYMPELIYFL